MPYTIKETKTYPHGRDTVYQAAIGAVSGLQGKVLAQDPATGAIDIWFDNIPGGSADVTDTSAVDGSFGGPYPTCQPTAYRVTGDPDLGELKDTYEVNQVEAWSESNKTVEFNSVSSTTR